MVHRMALSDEWLPMKRTVIRRHPRKDPVTPGVYLAVMRRDNGCVAPKVDPNCGPCSKRLTLEHVKDELRMGERAPSDAAHLVVLCTNHVEAGMTAGRIWNTRTETRARIRQYLREHA